MLVFLSIPNMLVFYAGNGTRFCVFELQYCLQIKFQIVQKLIYQHHYDSITKNSRSCPSRFKICLNNRYISVC